ncbi:MAG TPA: type III-B CRISPR module-associated protein Cmr5 [Pseudonocardiaceae bacterium]|nr:type III-B CRISPR module-associated protein Cmr5 [Pseudonocardiaceae bacterium]
MALRRMDHDLASKAAEVVPAVVTDDMRTRFAGLPSMIMTSGLTATGAFLLARANSDGGAGADKAAYSAVADALLRDAATFARIPVDPSGPEGTLANIATVGDAHRGLLAETRARAFATWLARIAAARRAPTPSPTTGTATDPVPTAQPVSQQSPERQRAAAEAMRKMSGR